MNESYFFKDLAVLMTLAGIVSVVFSKLKWPKVLGYIGAGVLMGKATWGGAFLNDEDTVRIVGQLGIVFLMFSMGLGFSPKQMKRIRSVAIPTAVLDTVVMTWLGYTIGHHLFGWGMLPSLVLGVAICDSATTMLAKVIDEMRWGDRQFVHLALGTSVFEDMLCVGLLAVVVGVANGNGLSITAAGTSLGALFVFLIAVIFFGFVLIPRLLKSVAKTHDNEALTLTILGFCFFVSWMAYRFDFSLAIGAFLVGMIGACSDVRSKLESLCEPLKSMFASVFFISIGLLVNPSEWWAHVGAIAILTAVVVVGKFVNCTAGSLLTGESVKTSVQVGMSLAQIGEFAFMIAIMYVGLTGDTTSPMFDVAVATSIITTLLNPTMIKLSDPVANWIDRKLPHRSKRGIETYRGFVAKLANMHYEMETHRAIRMLVMQLGFIAILNFAVAIAFTLMNERDWSKFSVFFDAHKKFVFCLLVNLFIVGMMAPALRIARTLGQMLAKMLVSEEDTKFHQWMRNCISRAVVLGIVVLFFCEMSMINVNIAPEEIWARWTIRGILLLAAVFGWRFFIKAAMRARVRFEEAVGAEDRREQIGRMLTISVPEKNVCRLPLDLVSPAIGGTVVSLNIRAKTGAMVVAIERGEETIRNIGPETEFRAGDTLVAVGDGPQIAALKDLLGIIA